MTSRQRWGLVQFHLFLTMWAMSYIMGDVAGWVSVLLAAISGVGAIRFLWD